jgi:hypothetical protein
MAFRKAVGAESLDLVEAVIGELGIVATADHVADHLGFELANGAEIAERCHGAA